MKLGSSAVKSPGQAAKEKTSQRFRSHAMTPVSFHSKPEDLCFTGSGNSDTQITSNVFSLFCLFASMVYWRVSYWKLYVGFNKLHLGVSHGCASLHGAHPVMPACGRDGLWPPTATKPQTGFSGWWTPLGWCTLREGTRTPTILGDYFSRPRYVTRYDIAFHSNTCTTLCYATLYPAFAFGDLFKSKFGSVYVGKSCVDTQDLTAKERCENWFLAYGVFWISCFAAPRATEVSG